MTLLNIIPNSIRHVDVKCNGTRHLLSRKYILCDKETSHSNALRSGVTIIFDTSSLYLTMAGLASTIVNSISRGFVFGQITRFINPELLSSCMYFGVLCSSGFLDYSTVESFGNYIIVEFLMIHSNVGIAVALFFSTNERTKNLLLIATGSFYFLFIIAIAIGFDAWWTAIIFVLIIYSRMNVPHTKNKKDDLIGEIMITFGRFFIYMICAGFGFLIAEYLFGGEDALGMIVWATIYYLLLFLLRNKLVLLRTVFTG